MKVYFAVFVWGEKYIKDFLALTLPSQFTESNILSVKGKTRYVIYTKENERVFFDVKIIDDLKSFCDVDFVFIDEIVSSSNKYNALGAVQNKAIVNAKNEGYEVFFPIYSDLLFSSNAIPYAIEKIEGGKYFVFSMAPQVIRNRLAQYLVSLSKSVNQGVELDPIEMTKFVLANLHPIRAPSVYREGQPMSFPSVFFMDTQEGYVGKAFHLHPVAFRLTDDEILMNKFIGTLDEHFVPILINRIEIAHVVDNTAYMCLCSFEEYDESNLNNYEVNSKIEARTSVINIAERHASKIHRQFFEKNIYFNIKGVGNKISNELQIELDSFTNSLLRELLIGNDQLKLFSYETYMLRKSFIRLKKRMFEYQIQQRSDILVSVFVWKTIKNFLDLMNLLQVKKFAVYEKRGVIKRKMETIFPFIKFGTHKKIYGSEVHKYAQGKSIIYLMYVVYIKFINKIF